jgi:hypothetical protein
MYINCAIMYIGFKPHNMSTISSIRHKHIRIDQAKLDKAKRVLFAATETEALDRALTLVVSEAAVDTVLRQVGSKGKLKKVFP